MSLTSHKRGAVVGFAFCAAFLATSSVAFACTFYKGKTTVSDFVVNPATGADTSVSQSVAEDGDPSLAHWYCTGAAQIRRPIELSGPKFTVMVGATTTCAGGQSALPGNKTYDVHWLDVTNAAPLAPMCQDQANWPSPKVATITTDSAGNGGAANNATVPALTAPRLVDICVIDPNQTTDSGPTVSLEVI